MLSFSKHVCIKLHIFVLILRACMLPLQDIPLISEDKDEESQDQERTFNIQEKRSFVISRSNSRVDRYKGIVTAGKKITEGTATNH